MLYPMEDSPPMFDAAMPVLAVTETTDVFLEYFLRRAAMIARSNKDLPEPVIATTGQPGWSTRNSYGGTVDRTRGAPHGVL